MENKIQQLVFSFLDMVKISRKEIESGIWLARIPENERVFFNSFETIKFTFDREKAELHRDLELVCKGSFLLRKIIERLTQIPKVSRLFSNREPEFLSKNALTVVSDKAYYRTKVIFNFKVQFECDKRREKLFSVMADAKSGNLDIEKGMQDIDSSEFSEEPQTGMEIEESGIDMLRLYLESCKKLEESLSEDIAELKDWGEGQCKENLKIFEAYLDDQKQELLKKKENVCFHLYFFQKEEEIDRLIDNLEEERKRKLSELREKFALRVNISLINAVVLCIPTVGVLTQKKRKSGGKSLDLASLRNSIDCSPHLAIQ